MALSTITVVIKGDTGQLVTSLQTAAKNVDNFNVKVQQSGKSVGGLGAAGQARGFSNLARAFTNAAGQTGVLNSEISILASSVGNVGLGAAAAGIGLGALAGGLVASIAAAVSFETAITKVAKTANFSAEETEAFGNEILALSRRLPVATSSLTAIAAVAGQLGIQGTANISKFVEEVAKLESTTNVGAEALATGLGTLIQVSGLPIDAIDNISAALTNLGNTSNSTEQQILDFSVRLVGIGAALGVPLADILSISSSFAAAGVPVERGGTAIQNILISIEEAAADGGAELALFADIAGLTTAEFSKLQATDPGIAFAKVADGLGDINNVLPVLKALEIADDRLVASFLAAANAEGSLEQGIYDTRAAAISGTATNEEFARSMDTTAAQLQLLKNNITATAITLGDVFNPALRASIEGLNDFIDAVKNGTVDAEIAVAALVLSVAGLAAAFGPLAVVPLGIAAIVTQMAILTNDTDTASNATLNFENAWFHAEIGILGVIHDVENAILTAILAPLNLAIIALNAVGNAGDALGITVDDIPTIGTESLGRTAAQKAIDEVQGRIGANTQALKNNRIISDLEAAAKADSAFRVGGGDVGGRDADLSGFPKGGGGAGASGPAALTVEKALTDGVISLMEALELGLSDATVVALELGVAQGKVADEDYRRRIGLQALAALYPGLNGEEIQFALALAAIEENLRLTNRTAEQFRLAEAVGPELDRLQSRLQGVLGSATREDLQLSLQKSELEERRLLLLSGGADVDDKRVKQVDAEIKNLDNLIRLRALEVDQLTIKSKLADASILTDAAQTQQTQLLTAAVGSVSNEFVHLQGAAYLAATALERIGGPAPTAPPLGLRDALIALGNLPDKGASLIPQLDTGGTVLKTGLAIVDKGERFYNNGSGPRGESGITPAPHFAIYITADSEASEASMRRLAKMVREEAETVLRKAAFQGSYVTSGAYTPS